MRLLSLFAVAMAGLIAVPALAQTPPPDGAPTRVRGTVEKLDDHNLTVKSRDGQSLSITLAPDVDIITLVKKSLADIKPGTNPSAVVLSFNAISMKPSGTQGVG